ncbi:MAG TPA: response regulator transcription factor [Candidatus Acidoferrum sp.]|jgi:DNA-binding NarL/FixJ family response regulator|nr:response regulator transcription factor [Candidatus Acidoferrum sp.]
MSKRIVVVDDHDVVRQGVRLILRSRPEWSVVGEASNGNEAVQKIKSQKPDLTILDISMPEKDGLEVLRDLKASGETPKVLVLSMHNSKEVIAAVRDLGASGYILKTNAARDLIRAMEEVFAGGFFFPGATTKTTPTTAPDAKSDTRKDLLFRLQLGFAGAFAG